ncbi:Pre-mRNA polyadenylation factor FIP1 [Nakaseomyces bracarensis]|uniref:Pre-mRNA polyadenylation factor FIP1 n=1 Tax=Nakaseomyces bracarensis TaxID=273131 RepID=A0ABR4NQ74_9SACH
MSSSDDDDDKFLYGSDNEQTSIEKKRSRADPGESSKETTAKRPKLGHGESNNDKIDSSDDEESGSDSDSDVEFIISTGPDPHRLDSSTFSAGNNNAIVAVTETSPANTSSLTKVATTATTAEISTLNALGDTEVAGTSELDEQALEAENTVLEGGDTIDLNKDGLYKDEPVSNIDPEVLKEKPWRQPGANLSDYFNYGFNEFTWMEYLHRQEKLRQEYNPRRLLMGLMALQQQGRLDQPQMRDQFNSSLDNKPLGGSPMPGDMSNSQNNNMMQQQNPAMPNFPMPPMFGGFAPFMPPGMMPPMNRMSNQNQGQNQGQNQNQKQNQNQNQK